MGKENKKRIRIALIGPESTAKSTLSEQLAKHYTTVWVKEYAREYLAEINRKYTLDDIVEIAKQQLQKEEEQVKIANNFIFIDTEFINAKVWCMDVFNTCPTFISDTIIKHKYDLFLLTYPDLVWEPDPLRENPNRRTFFFNWYEQELKSINANYTVIKGLNETRLNNCINAIENYLSESKINL
jgi:NadR type nicotinamide-nucleotide adenylyltransferase